MDTCGKTMTGFCTQWWMMAPVLSPEVPGLRSGREEEAEGKRGGVPVQHSVTATRLSFP